MAERYTQKQLWHMAKAYFEAKEFGSHRCAQLINQIYFYTGMIKDQIEYELNGIIERGEE